MALTGKQIYRIVLDSSDKLSGTWNNGLFAVNAMRDPPLVNSQDRVYCQVESFVVDNAAYMPDRYMVAVPTLSLIHAPFYSKFSGELNVLLVHSGSLYQNFPLSTSLGHECNASIESLLVSKQHRVQILDPTTGQPYVSTSSSANPAWTLSLVFYSKSLKA
jgi:hypothetical protein